MLKANFDAAINVSSHRLRIGVVIRDCEGEGFATKYPVKVLSGCVFTVECFAFWEVMVCCVKIKGYGMLCLKGKRRELLMS